MNKVTLSLATVGHDGTVNLIQPKGMTEAQVVGLGKLGLDCIQAEVSKGEKYLELCRYIRKEQIGPAEVRSILSDLGFHKVRISEVNKVSQLTDEMWDEYEARTIGFRQALELSRGAMPVMLENPQETLDKKNLVAALPGRGEDGEEVEGDERGTENQQNETDEDKKAKRIEAMARAAVSILNAAEFLALSRKKIYDKGNGWIVTVEKKKVKKQVDKPAAKK